MKDKKQCQTMLALAFLADLESSKAIKSQPEAETAAQTNINTFLQSDGCAQGIGAWELCQKPIIYVAHKDGAPKDTMTSRNTTVILKKVPLNTTKKETKTQEFVIGVAGTNFINSYDWFTEDVQITKQIPWSTNIVSYGTSEYTRPKTNLKKVVSESTAIALSNTWNIGNSDGSTLTELLKNSLPTEGEVIISVTGHSLGGAISPALALALEENKADWCPSGVTATISTYIFAGPTAGDKDWVKYLKENLDGVTSVYNSHDLVPHAWNLDMIKDMRTLFTPNLPATNADPYGKIADTLIDWILAKSTKAKHKYERYEPSLFNHHKFKGVLPGAGKYSSVHTQAAALRKVIEADWLKTNDNHVDALNAICRVCGIDTSDSTITKMYEVGPYLQYFCEFVVILGIEHVDAYHDWIDNAFLSSSMKYYLQLGTLNLVELQGVGVVYRLFLELGSLD